MPVYSDQIGGMINQQNQMFAGYGAFASGFSPGAPPGMMGYGGGDQSPYGGAYPTFPSAQFEAGQHVLGGVHAALPAAIGAATFAGAFLPGAAGRAIGRLDPFQAALSGFGRASGVSRGMAGMGVMDSIGQMGSNIGRIGAGGVGNVFRAGLTGAGGAAAAAFLPLAGMAAVTHATGQMAQGAQFTGQVHRTLGENFRFLNPASQTGHGFSREQGAEIADTVRTMGNKDIMSSPQELLRVMNQSIQGGMFRPVQDAKQFQDKFKEVVGALKEISKTFNTTLEGAMPFLQEGRRMGFWTPADVQRMASSTVGTAKLTGLSVAQVQQMQGQGASMARQVGAAGTTGAEGMTKTLGIVGGAIRGGTISEQQLSEMTGGLMGGEAIQAFSGQMQASATRFASSRTARWLLAATAGKDMKHLDAGKLALLSSGQMGLGGLRESAEKNVQGRGADFVMGEEEMRGDLLKQGPEAQMGFLRGIAGKRLFGETGMDKLATRRLIQRFMGGDSKQADAMAKILRDLPNIMRENVQRTEAEADQQQRDHTEMMEHSYEGLKRKVSLWWKSSIDEPLQKVGASVAESIGDSWERLTDKVWGRTPRSMRNMGITSGMASALREEAMGRPGAARAMFASQGEVEKQFGAPSGGMSAMISDPERMMRGGTGREALSAIGVDFGVNMRTERRTREGLLEEANAKFGAVDAASGPLNLSRAKAMGFSDMESARAGLKTVGKVWENAGVDRFASGLQDSNPMERAKKIAARISSDPGVSPEIKAQLAGKTPEQQAAIISAGTDETNRGRLGLDMSDLAKQVKSAMGVDTSGENRKSVEDSMTSSLNNLAEALTPKTAGGTGTQGSIGGGFVFSDEDMPQASDNRNRLSKLLNGEDGDVVRTALAFTGSDDPGIKARGHDMLQKLALKHGKDPGMHDMLNSMATGSNPDVAKAVADVAKNQKLLNFFDRNETVQNRLTQTRESMMSKGEEEYSGIMKGLNETGLGGIAELIEGGDKLTGAEITKKLSSISEKASTMDPEQVARVQAMLKDVKGAGMIQATLGGALEQRGLKSAFARGKSHSLGEQAGALSGMSGQLLGRSLTSQEVSKIQGKGGKEFIEQLITEERKKGSLSEGNVDTFRDMVMGVKEGGSSRLFGAQKKLMDANISASLSNVAEKQRDLAGGLLGKLGSPSGIHQQLIDIGLTLKAIKDGGQLKGPDNPKGMRSNADGTVE